MWVSFSISAIITEAWAASAIIARMPINLTSQNTPAYEINTEVYAGPLDLLLDLIERAELDITRLALAQVTDQYLAYLKTIEERDPTDVSAFLVIAARLIQIKSAALLPRPSIDSSLAPEEDPGDALARQLIIYKRFKELAVSLDDRQSNNQRSYLRLAEVSSAAYASHFDLSDISLEDLVAAAREIFYSENLPPLSQVISNPRITIRDRIRAIITRLKTGHTTFRGLLSQADNRVEIVVTFLAMLELIKRRVVLVEQASLFGDIEMAPAEDWAEATEFDIEFDE